MLLHSKNRRSKEGGQMIDEFKEREPTEYEDVVYNIEKKEKKISRKREMHHGHITASEGKCPDGSVIREPPDDDGKYEKKKKKKKHKRITADNWVKCEIAEYNINGSGTCSYEAVNVMTEPKREIDHIKYNNEAGKKTIDSTRNCRTTTEVTADVSNSRDGFHCTIHGKRKKKEKKKKKSSKSRRGSFTLVDIPSEELTCNHRKENLHNIESSNAHLEREKKIDRKLAQGKKEKNTSHTVQVEVLTESDGSFLQADTKKDNGKKRKRKHQEPDPSVVLEENNTDLVVTKRKRSSFSDMEVDEAQEYNCDRHIAKKKKKKKRKEAHIPGSTEIENEKISKSSRTYESSAVVLYRENNIHSVSSSCDKNTKKYGGKPQRHKESKEAFEVSGQAINNSALESKNLAAEHELDSCRTQKIIVSKYHLKWHISAKDKEECRKLGIEFEKGRWRPEEIERLHENFQSILLQTGMTTDDLVNLIDDTSTEARKRRIDLGIYHILLEGINRPIQLVHQKLKKLCDPTHFKGKWLKSEEETLLELYNTHGNNWVKIGELMGRSGDSVLHKIQRLLCGPVTKSAARVANTSRWAEDEIERLSIAVEEIRSNLEDNCNDARKSDSKHIPWSKVANAVKTRSAESCRYKWVFDVSLREAGNKKMHWTTMQNVLFLEKLSTCGKKHENDVDWIQLLKDLKLPGTEPVAKRKWKAYRLMIPHHKELDFEKQLDWLINNFVKRIKEKGHFREATSLK